MSSHLETIGPGFTNLRRQRGESSDAADIRRILPGDLPVSVLKISLSAGFLFISLHLMVIAQEVTSRKLPTDFRPVTREVTFPERKKAPESANRARLVRGKNGGYHPEFAELPRRSSKPIPATPEEMRQGKTTLRRMAAYFGKQGGFRFALEAHLNEQGAMGSFAVPSEFYDVSFRRPNLLRVASKRPLDPKTEWRLASDGEHLLRSSFGRVCVQQTPGSLTELIAAPATETMWHVHLDARSILSLFDPVALEAWMEPLHIYQRGTRQYGDVLTDHLVIDGRGEAGRFTKWHLYVTQGATPVPLRIDLDHETAYDPRRVKGRVRFRDSDLRFRDWIINPTPQAGEFTLTMPSLPLVDGMGSLASGEPKALHPMCGRDLPEFTAIDAKGDTVTGDDLVSDGPCILIVYADSNSLPYHWHKIDRAATRLEGEGVTVRAIYTGRKTGKDIAETFNWPRMAKKMNWRSKPEILSQCSAPNRFTEDTIFVVDTKKKIHAAYRTRGRYDLEGELVRKIRGVLAGRDVALKSAVELRRAQEARKKRRVDLIKAFRRRADQAR